MEYLREIIYTVDYRGDNDDVLCLLFRGISCEDLAKSLSILVPDNGKGVAHSFEYINEQDYYRNGKSSRHVVMKVYNPNTFFCSISDLCLLVEARLCADYRITINKVDIKKFLNS